MTQEEMIQKIEALENKLDERSEVEKKVKADVSLFPLGKIYIVEICATVVITQNVEFKDFQSKD